MRTILTAALVMLAVKGFATSSTEKDLVQLSAKVFTWEVENKFDSISTAFDDKFIAYTSSGSRHTKSEYLTTLRSGKIMHDGVELEESEATIINNTATVAGKGKFTVTVNGTKKKIHLSYLEVFIRRNARSPWKMLTLHAGSLNN